MDSAGGENDPLIYTLGDPASTSDQSAENDGPGPSAGPDEGRRAASDGPETAGSLRKNLLVLSLAFLLNFTAYNALQNLQSSLHPETGVASLAVVYGSLILSCFLAPALIRGLGAKWTVAASLLCYVVYTASNYYPRFYTLVPAGLLLGLGAAPLWIAQGTYLTTTAIRYAELAGSGSESVINQFNGVFFFFFQGSQITGNLVASLVLFPWANGTDVSWNQTQCGLHVCGGSGGGSGGNDTQGSVRPETAEVLVSVYLVCGLLSALLVGLFLGRLRSAGRGLVRTTRANLVATLRLLANPRVLMLIPLFVYTGIEQAFIYGDFTKAYVTCTNGIHQVGFVMMAFGVTDALCSILFGQLEKYAGRVAIVTGGGLAHALVLCVLLFVPGVNEGRYSLWDRFVLAAAWGFGDAVWQTQTASIIGVIFKEDQESAFSNFRLFQALGFCVYFALSTLAAVCVLHKVMALGILLIVSLVLYYVVEWKIRKATPF